MVPPILVAMVAHPKPLPLGQLRKVLSGGAPLSKELIEGFRDYPQVEILQGYGLTESTAIGASTDFAEESRRYGTADREHGNRRHHNLQWWFCIQQSSFSGEEDARSLQAGR